VEVQQQYGDQVEIVGIASQDDLDAFTEFVNDTSTGTIAHIPDESGEVWEQFGITRRSQYIYIDDKGEWREAQYGTLEQDVQDLIAN